MKNINELMKQAQQMQEKITELQKQLKKETMEGKSGGGIVTVTVNGKGEAKGIKIDPSLVNPDEIEMLEDLIVAAFNDAKRKMDSHVSEEMSELTGGLKIPSGFNLPI
jgi:DNA-binding YbaB/EbfC family protein